MLIINPWLIAITAILVVAFIVFAVYKAIVAHQNRAFTGREDIIGGTAVAKTAVAPKGNVLFRGELWEAKTQTGDIKAGEEVTIVAIDGLTLKVIRK